MSRFEDFKQGERVAHIARGDGVVSQVTDDVVRVTFDEKLKNGAAVVGAYDRNWFRVNPGFLFHRRTDPTDLMAETGQDPHRDM